MRSNASSQTYRKRVKELEKVSLRIAAKMVKLKKAVSEISNNRS